MTNFRRILGEGSVIGMSRPTSYIPTYDTSYRNHTILTLFCNYTTNVSSKNTRFEVELQGEEQ